MKTIISFTDAFNKKYFREKYILDQIIKFNKGKAPDWSDFTSLFLSDLVEHFKEVLPSRNSARTYVACLKSLIKKYSEEIKIPCREYKEILTVKKSGIINFCLTPEEIQQLINYKSENDTEHTIRNQFVLSCLTGMRFSDVIHLNETNIQNGEIIYVAEKTQTTVRTLYGNVTEHLIREEKNHIFSDWTFNKIIKEICRKAGINKIVQVKSGKKKATGEKWRFVTSHTARRSFATNIYLRTWDIVLVSQYMGHSDVSITQGYLCCAARKSDEAQAYADSFSIAA